MARIPYPDPATQDEALRARLARLGSLNVTRMMAHNEGLMHAYAGMGVQILARGRLDPVLREAVILRVGQLCDSEYEWYQHESVACAVGMDEAMLEAIRATDFAALPDRVRLAIACAEEIHADGVIAAATFERAAATFAPDELVELTLVIGYYRMTAGYLRSFAIEREAVPLGAAIATLPAGAKD